MVNRKFRIFENRQSEIAELELPCDLVSFEEALKTITFGEIEIVGQLANSSNAALLGRIQITDDSELSVVIKSSMYENPLVDFEWGTLVKREVAAYEVSNALGWKIVPPTVLREVDEMLCSVQLFIPHDPRRHYFNITKTRKNEMEKFAVFDLITNNADRKAGHIIEEEEKNFDLFISEDQQATISVSDEKRLWGIDHGLTFNAEDKLRTVIWEFAEKPISDHLMKDVHVLHSIAPALLEPYLNAYEIEKTINRIETLMLNPFHKALDVSMRAIPYPLV